MLKECPTLTNVHYFLHLNKKVYIHLHPSTDWLKLLNSWKRVLIVGPVASED